MPGVADLMKNTYGFGDKKLCARYQLASAGVQVPIDLLPNDNARARELLSSRQESSDAQSERQNVCRLRAVVPVRTVLYLRQSSSIDSSSHF